MSTEQPDDVDRPHSNRGRLRRNGRSMMRLGLALLALSLVVTLISGFTTRSMLEHLRTNSSELLDGRGTVTLSNGATRVLYVTGGLVAPGEDVPTPVEDITCVVTGPEGNVPVSHLKDEDRRVGLDNPLARFQVVGSFSTRAAGEHTIECTGLGVVVAPEVSPASALLRLGGLMLGSLGVFAGATLALIGGVLQLVMRRTADEVDDDADDVALPPQEGPEEWWEDENAEMAARVRAARRAAAAGGASAGAGAGVARAQLEDELDDDLEDELDEDDDLDDDDLDDEDDSGEDSTDQPDSDDDDFEGDAVDEEGDDGYVRLTDEELAEMSDEEIADLLRSGALVYVDEDGHVLDPDTNAPDHAERGDTYR